MVADSIIMYSNVSSTVYPPSTNLQIKNNTRNRTGAFLQNIGDGRTRFSYAIDSAYSSADTLYLLRAAKDTSKHFIGGGAAGWRLTGNAGTNSGNFIGTTDNKPVNIAANNKVIARADTATALVLYPDNSRAMGSLLHLHATNFAINPTVRAKIQSGNQFGGNGSGTLREQDEEGAIFFAAGGNPIFEINSGQNNNLLLRSADGKIELDQADGFYQLNNIPSSNDAADSMLVIKRNGMLGKRKVAAGGTSSQWTTSSPGIYYASPVSIGTSTVNSNQSLLIAGTQVIKNPNVNNSNSIEVQDAAGNILAYIRRDGFVSGQYIGTADNNTAMFNQSYAPSGFGINVVQGKSMSWNAGAWYGAPIAALYSNTAGVIEINNGTPGTGNYADLILKNIKATGSLALSYVKKTASYNANVDDYTIDFTSGSTLTLPAASGCAGRIYVFVNRTGGFMNVATTGGDTVPGGPGSGAVYGWDQAWHFQSDGSSKWIIIATR